MASSEELFWQVALTLVPGIDCVTARCLLHRFGTASEVFRAARRRQVSDADVSRAPALFKTGDRGTWAGRINAFSAHAAVERTLAFSARHDIHIYCMEDLRFPLRLREAWDGPTVLYYKGPANLNRHHLISVVGALSSDPRTRAAVREMIGGLTAYGVLVVSGLDEGVETMAHCCALEFHLPSAGVLAHGMDRIYPPQNRALARAILEQGGLLTEYAEGLPPEKTRFFQRQRILAAISEATLVIASGNPGNSMVTARLAQAYNNSVFAVPGRPGDISARGCNALIRDNIAGLVTCADDIAKDLNWKTLFTPGRRSQAPKDPKTGDA